MLSESILSKKRHAAMMADTAKTPAVIRAGSTHPSAKNAGARRKDIKAMYFMLESF